MPDAAQIKGFALRGLLRYVKDSGYPGGIPALLARLPEEDRSYFAEKILSSLWYPYEAFSALARIIDQEIARGDVAVLEDVGHASGRLDLGGVFRFVTAILTVERIVSRAPAYWRRYCDAGELRVTDKGSNHFTVQLVDFPGVDEAHCHMIRGWIRGLGDSTKARDVDIRKTMCVHRGDACCEYTGTWT